jgi:uncharacterized damage-inducible protein DinB
MDAFDIYVDTAASGRVMAHLLEPPGLGVRFESRGVMRPRLPRAIAAHLAWLRRHGERVPTVRPDKYRIVSEVFVAGNFESGDDVGFYPPDAVPVTEDEVERYLSFAGYAHDDLLTLVQGLNDSALDWTRDQRIRSIRQILSHVVGAELWYMTRIIDDPTTQGMPGILDDADLRIDATADAVERVRIVWRAFQLWTRSLTPDLRSRITVASWFTERKDEQWSARKMLRRCIEHCREHTRTVEQILAARRATTPPTR